MTQRVAPDIQRIISALKQREMHVTGPVTRDGQSVYTVNDHSLNEAEIRTLATEDQLTTWGIYSYVKARERRRGW